MYWPDGWWTRSMGWTLIECLFLGCTEQGPASVLCDEHVVRHPFIPSVTHLCSTRLT